jgi:hypothetical protein
MIAWVQNVDKVLLSGPLGFHPLFIHRQYTCSGLSRPPAFPLGIRCLSSYPTPVPLSITMTISDNP